jgi:tetratricopeptide (TPR) repeat protein
MSRVLPLLIALFSFSALKSNIEQYNLFQKANRHALAGNNALAATEYRQLLDRYPAGILRCEASFNLAGTEFNMKHYRQAADMFSSLPPGNSTLSGIAGYNRGNALAMEAFRNRNTPGYQELLERALACYRNALLQNPRNDDARINFEIVSRALQRHKTPPPPTPAPESGGDKTGGGGSSQGLNSDISRLILENARQEEARQMRRYFRPLAPKQQERDQPDW